MTLYSLFNSACPAGTTEFTVDDGRYTYISDVSLQSTGGSLTASHTHSTYGSFNSWRFTGNTILPGVTTQSIDITQKGIRLRACSVINHFLFPRGTILLSDSTACPFGWNVYSTANSNYVRFTENSANSGTSVAFNRGYHTHSASSTTSSLTDPAGGAGEVYSDYAIANDPTLLYHIRLALCQKQ